MEKFIQNILENKTNESATLEFKDFEFSEPKISSLEPKQVNSLIEVICSFANYNGGRIIIGIQEDKQHNPTSIKDCNITKETFEAWEQSFRNKIATSTIPVLYGISVQHVCVEEKNCIVIDVPRSFLKPHACNNGGTHRFYIRNGNESRPMNYYDLKQGFQYIEYLQDKIKRFRDERISYILNEDLFAGSSEAPSVVVHIIPECSLDESFYIALRKYMESKSFRGLSTNNVIFKHAFNADGLFCSSFASCSNHSDGYHIQFFQSGMVEIVDNHIFNYHNPDKSGEPKDLSIICEFSHLEDSIVRTLYQYCKGLYNDIGVKSAFYLSVSLLNVKGKKAKIFEWEESSYVKKNIINTNFVKWSTDESFEEAMLPILTTLAHTFGMGRSSFYNKDLSPNSKKFFAAVGDGGGIL